MGSSVRGLAEWLAEYDRAWSVRDFEQMRHILAIVQGRHA